MHLFLAAVLEHCNNADCASEKQHAPQEKVGAVTGVGYIGVEHGSALGLRALPLVAESMTYFTVCFRNTGRTLHLLWAHCRWDRT